MVKYEKRYLEKPTFLLTNKQLKINAIANSENLMAIEVSIKINNMEKQIIALIDTGACVSLIDKKICDELKVSRVNSNRTLLSITNQEIHNAGEVELSINIGDNCLDKHTFIVVSGLQMPTSMLIGTDFLLNRNIVLKVVQEAGGIKANINIDGICLPLVRMKRNNEIGGIKEIEHDHDEEEILHHDYNIKVQICESEKIPSLTAGYVIMKVNSNKSIGISEAIFEPCLGNPQARILYPGIVKLNNSVFCVPYVNTESESLTLESNKTLGFLYEIQRKPFGCDSTDVKIISTIHTQETGDRLQKLMNIVDTRFSQDTQKNEALKNLIKKYPSVFTTEDEPLTVTPYFVHTIKQHTPCVIYRRPYTIPVKYYEGVKNQLDKLQKQGIIRPSKSPYNNPLVPVPKKDGSIRLCLDFRALNATLRDDRYPLPNINSILTQMGDSSLFSCLDMKMGYHQIRLSDDSTELTAFTAPEGHYEFTSMPFGLKDAPSAYQRIINTVLIGLIGRVTHVYLDDFIVYGKDFRDHVINLDRVLERLSNAKLSLKFEKCRFFQEEVSYLGHIISFKGIKPQPEKVKIIKDIPIPKTIHELQSFLGLINYYRKFILNCAKICNPLTKLLIGKKKKVGKKDKTPVTLTPEAIEAFDTLKNKLAQDIPLAFPNFNKPFILTTDASSVSIGGVLEQEDDNHVVRPITYFSRTLNTAERRYSVIEREALSIVYALKINRPLCLGFPITIRSDHKPLKWLLTTSSPNHRIARWQTLLAEFDFNVEYIPGQQNVVADFLSRLREDEDIEFEDPRDEIMLIKKVQSETINDKQNENINTLSEEYGKNITLEEKNVETSKQRLHMKDQSQKNAESIGVVMVVNEKRNEKYISDEGIVNWNLQEIISQQDNHEIYGPIKQSIMKKENKENNIKMSKVISKIYKDFVVHNKILYRKLTSIYGETTYAIVLSSPEYIEKALFLSHSSPTAGHGGIKVTLARCKKLCFWPTMRRDVENYCKKCDVCCRYKRVRESYPAPLRHYPDVTNPFERVHMDLVGPLNESEIGSKYILTVIDVLTRFLIAVPIINKTAAVVANAFFTYVVCAHGVPNVVVTDQGTEFINEIFRGVAQKLGLKHLKTTPFNPSANGVIERPHSTLINIMRTLVQDNRSIWDEMLPIAVYAYNTAYHRTIRDSPFYLLYFRDPMTPYSTIIEENPMPWYNIDSYKHRMTLMAQKVYERCAMYLEEGRIELERNYKKSKIKPIKIGDRVYIKNVYKKGEPTKLQAAYNGPYRVIKKISDVVVTVKNLNTNKIVTLHTNRVRLLHEDCVDIKMQPNIRKAYPLKDNKNEMQEFLPEGPIISLPDEENICNEETSVPSSPVDPVNEDITQEQVHQNLRYNLRSSTTPQELPYIMPRPIEYKKS